MTGSNNCRLLAQSLREHRRGWLILPLLGSGSMLAALLAPELQKQFIDALTQHSDWVWWFLAAALACSGIQWGLAGIGQYLNGRISCSVFAELKTRLLQKLLDLPQEFFARRQSGYLTARLELDTAGMNYFYSQEYWQLALSGGALTLGLAILGLQNWGVGVLVAAGLTLHFILLRRFLRRNYQLNRECGETMAQGYGELHAIFSNMATVKTQIREAEAEQKVKKRYRDTLALNLKLLHLEFIGSIFLKVFPAAVRLLILLFGVYQIGRAQWSLGELWALLAYTGLVFAPAAAVANNLMSREHARAALDRVEELYRNLPEENLELGIVPAGQIALLEVENLRFGYDRNSPVIRDLSFALRRGEMLAVTGASGSGKSTLMSLLLLLYRPQAGGIRFDGVPAEQYHLRALRRRIGYVCQNPQFFPGTLRENLGGGAPGELERFMASVGAASLLARLDESLDEAAANFSAGEKIRLAVVRELLRHTDVVILDEPTANLDAVQEEALLELLTGSLKDKILIIVTHRSKALEYAARTIQLEKATL